jgi:hypothetical protein
LDISHDERFIVSGSSDGTAILWDTNDGKPVKFFKGHQGHISSVAFIHGSSKIMTCGYDGTGRIWDYKSGEQIAKLLTSPDGEWIIATPDGYYANSSEGDNLLHLATMEGNEVFSFEQFESVFNRPDIITARLSGKMDHGKPAPIMTPPPRIIMKDHMSSKTVFERAYLLKLAAISVEEVKIVRVFVNGKPTAEIPVMSEKDELTLKVPLFSGANRITAVAYDKKGFSSNPKFMDVFSKNINLEIPDLYILAIGISKYPKLSPQWQLDFAHTDAQALVKTFNNLRGNLYADVRADISTNAKATKANIQEALNALSRIDENDLVVIFMAGHGVRNKNGTFFFLTSESNYADYYERGLSWEVLQNHLSQVNARIILLLDACHSGSIVTQTVVPNDELAQQLFQGKRSGVMIFAASKGSQYSLESAQIGGGYGIFTHTLLEGLQDKAADADFNGNNVVEFLELVDYVSGHVDKATGGKQTPWLSRKEMFGDFPIVMVK